MGGREVTAVTIIYEQLRYNQPLTCNFITNDVMLGWQAIMSSTDHRQWNSIHWYEDKTHKLGDFKYAVYGHCSEANWELYFQREDFG